MVVRPGVTPTPVTDLLTLPLGRGHVLSAAFFSGPIKHQTEKIDPQSARKTGYFPLFIKKRYKFKNVFLDLSKTFAAV